MLCWDRVYKTGTGVSHIWQLTPSLSRRWCLGETPFIKKQVKVSVAVHVTRLSMQGLAHEKKIPKNEAELTGKAEIRKENFQSEGEAGKVTFWPPQCIKKIKTQCFKKLTSDSEVHFSPKHLFFLHSLTCLDHHQNKTRTDSSLISNGLYSFPVTGLDQWTISDHRRWCKTVDKWLSIAKYGDQSYLLHYLI